MRDAGEGDRLRQARDELRRACSLLEAPSLRAMADCSRALESAEARLRGVLAARPAAPDPALLEGALELARWVGRTQRLLDAAAEFHSDWMERLGVMTGGYSAGGRPAPVAGGASLALEA